MVGFERSDPAPVISGVPQGSVLGPILFLIFINDLPDQLKSKARLFADDCIVYHTVSTTADSEVIQQDLNTLADWERRWGMEFHPMKCNVLSCTKSRKPHFYDYQLKGHVLARLTTAKYLGVDISSDLSWKHHIDRSAKKANNMLGFLKRNLKTPDRTTKCNAYFALVRPHLEYCSSVWNPHTANLTKKIEAVQRRAARYVTSDYNPTSSVTAMLKDLNWETLQSRRTKGQLNMFYKIVNNQIDIPPDPYLTPGSSRTRSNHSQKFRHVPARTNVFKFSFFPPHYPHLEFPPSNCC
ncbi:hypothetical protein ACOMHN_010745 [Nucella lapillus]